MLKEYSGERESGNNNSSFRDLSKTVVHTKEDLASAGITWYNDSEESGEKARFKVQYPRNVSHQRAAEQRRPEPSLETLDERAKQNLERLAEAGIVYTGSSPLLANKLYDRELGKLYLGGDAELDTFRGEIEEVVYKKILPKVAAIEQDEGIKDPVERSKQTIQQVFEGLNELGGDPSLLERLFADQGRRYFPLMSRFELLSLKREGDDVYWQNVFTHSPDGKKENDEGKGNLQIFRGGIPTTFYGRFRLLNEEGALVWSASSRSLKEQDPNYRTLGDDELLNHAATWQLLTNSNEDFWRDYKEIIRSGIPEYTNLSFEEIKERRKEERKRSPTLGDYLTKAEIPIFHNGEIIGLVKAAYRQKYFAMQGVAQNFGEDPKTRAALQTMAPKEEQRGNYQDIARWLVEEYVGKIKGPEFRFLKDAKDEQGNLLFPIPLKEELEKDSSLWERKLHYRNNQERFEQSQILRDYILEGIDASWKTLEDSHLKSRRRDGLETLLGGGVRRKIVETLKREREKNPDEQHIPKYLNSLEEVANAGLKTIYGRMVIPVMEEYFPEVLEKVQRKHGLQRDVTREDLLAVRNYLETAEPDSFSILALLETLNAVAPTLVNALGHAPSESIVGSGKDLESRVSLIGQRLAHFEVMTDDSGRHKVLGEGGMGVVYAARRTDEDVKEAEPLVLKILSGPLVSDPTFQRRFKGEARVGMRMRHPNIVAVYESGKVGPEPFPIHYMAVERMKGSFQDTVENAKTRKQFLDWRQVHRALVDSADALKYMKKKGIVHRDIKPDNLLMSSEGEFKIGDFGLAASEEEAMQNAGVLLGSPHFMSPEQIQGQAVDHQTDLYSLGASAYVGLTGKTPYQAETLNQLLGAIPNPSTAPVPIESIREDVPEQLISVVNKLMTKDKSRRYKDAKELLADLATIDLSAAA